MQALLLEYPGETVPTWLAELADEFVEDPQCRLVLLGSDSSGVALITIWETDMVGEVEAGLVSLVADGARLRRLKVFDPRNPDGLL
jgi:hypothetical protein